MPTDAPTKETPPDELLAEAVARVRVISESLPKEVDPLHISYSAKIPYKLLCYREALIWRLEELARNACAAFTRGDLVAAAVLTRSVTEVSAASVHLYRLVDRQLKDGITTDLNEIVNRLLLGHGNDADFPKSINVMTMVRHVEKEVPNFRAAYDSMSDLAHPNWAGTAGAYGEPDYETHITHLGVNTDRYRNKARPNLIRLNASLLMFEVYYNKTSEAFPELVALCEGDLQRENSESRAAPTD